MDPLRAYDLPLGNGVTLPVREHGDPEGLPLLLLHGYSDTWRSFLPVLSLFPRDIRAIAFTARGHGEATKPQGGYAPSDFAADAVALLDRLDLSRAVLCGHSMGSFVAQRVALDRPDRVAGLILEGSFPSGSGNPALDDLWESGVAPMGETADRAFTYEFQAACVSRLPESGIVDIAADDSLRMPVHVWKAGLGNLLAADHGPELARLRAPTLLIWGTRDAFFPRADQEALLAGIPDVRLSVHEGVGHSVHWEEPEAFVREVAGFARACLHRELQPA